MVNRETDATRVVRDVHVVHQMRREGSRSHYMAISALLRDLEVTATGTAKSLLDGHLRLADVDLVTVPARNLIDGTVMVAFAPI